MKSHSQLARIVSLLLAVALETLGARIARAETPATAASATPPNLQLPIPSPASMPETSSGTSESKPTPSRAIENSVVKVFSSMRAPDLAKPWTRGAATEVSGTGVVIEGKRILTNAHIVVFSSEIQVQANQAGDKLSATVEAIAPGIDLAVLRLEDEKFFETHSPLSCAEKVPDIKDAVMVYGFPTGGTNLSITKGIVSRIEFAPYNFPAAGLRIQLDAAINPGNSGGPAVVDDKMIGLAFSRLGGADNIGYVIPCEEIALFLRDLADGHYDGKPGFYEQWQTLENAALRAYLKLNAEVQGVIVTKPFSDGPSYLLKKWDTITHIGDTPIDNQGMVKIGSNLRVHFPYLIQQIAKDQKVPLTIIRGGVEKHIDLPLERDYPLTIRVANNNYPLYFVFGPLVFSEATTELIGGLSKAPQGADWLIFLASSGSPLVRKFGEAPAFPDERVVYVSSPFFPHKLSKGYGNPTAKVVQFVNGQAVRNLQHLVEIIRDSTDEFITIEFAGRNSETFVFPRKEAMAATEDILNDNGVRSQGSPELMTIWTAKQK